mmetsp:Transcript_19600/g.16741  ORF Transcript_19600/g.16741 Transcript_19600/m.16741 type:complete len:134 (+) Transcript_19600:1222-1623(+)
MMYLLEKSMGGQFMLKFLRKYIKKYREQVIKTDDFLDTLYETAKEEYPNNYQTKLGHVDINKWLYSTGWYPQDPGLDREYEMGPLKLANHFIKLNSEKAEIIKKEPLNEYLLHRWHTYELSLFMKLLNENSHK